MSSLTYDAKYNKPLKYKVEIWDPLEDNRLFLSDGFNPNKSNLIVEKINVSQAQWETWNSSIQIDDSEFNELDTDILDNGTVMKVIFGKDENNLQNAFYGIIDKIGPFTSGGLQLKYQVAAKGFGVINTYSFVNFQKVPPPETLVPGASITSASSIPFYANNMVRSLIGDIDLIPTLDLTIKERFGKNFSIDDVVDTVTEFIPGIKNPLVTSAEVLNIISQMSGAVYYIDQNKKLQFHYPSGNNQGIIIKDYYESTDLGDYTSYIKEGTTFNYTDSTDPSEGFANQLFSFAEKLDLVNQQPRALNFTSLYNKDLAFAAYAGPSKFQNMTFIMSKVGAGTDAPDPNLSKVYGFIVEDRNLTPIGNVVSGFSINIADITDSPQPIVNITRPITANIQPDKIYWIVLLERGSGEDNTIRLWHDDDVTTPADRSNLRYCATRPIPDNRRNTNVFARDNWYVSATGPQFTLSFATSQTIPLEASEPNSIAKWTPNRPIQAKVTIPTLRSIQASQAYLNALVDITSQKIRNYDSLEVSIPNNIIYPATEVQVSSNVIKDLNFFNNRIAWVKSVDYSLDVNDFSLGSKFCKVALRGYVSPLG